MTTEVSTDPRTGIPNGTRRTSTPAEVDAVVAAAAAAAPALAAAAPRTRATWLRAVADALAAPCVAEELVALADSETGLGRPRLEGELARASAQLRFYATVAEEGSYLRATIDRPVDGVPALARVQIPLGPVAVFGASNFPFAFGVLGNDTAAALAAGCPVVAKGHPAHPLLSRALAEVAVRALAGADAPAGTFGLVTGLAGGSALVDAPQVRAVAFTGSQAGGMALRARALARPTPIPVFAEMGTVNPVVVTEGGCADLPTLAAGFVRSFTAGTGQFCTKPGLLLAPAGRGVPDAVAEALEGLAPAGWSLTEPIATAAAAGVDALVAAGATVRARLAGPGTGFTVDSVLLTAPAEAVVPGSRLVEECFGPVAIVVEYDGLAELAALLDRLQGTLAASVMAGADDGDLARVLELLVPLVGRVSVGDWPTGVATTWAQHHGGPWPATSEPGATSVGAAALDRFVRPVAYQSVPDAVLPPALQSTNPWSVPRRVDGVLVSA